MSMVYIYEFVFMNMNDITTIVIYHTSHHIGYVEYVGFYH
jgi:hypothetical protein